MKYRQPTFIEILYPRSYPNNPKRVDATRTIMQPECDLFEQFAASSANRDPGENSSAQVHPHRSSITGGVT